MFSTERRVGGDIKKADKCFLNDLVRSEIVYVLSERTRSGMDRSSTDIFRAMPD
ncbi:MAG: hypothetical protein AB7V04_05965 [Desulfomonilaceae bacterium]